MPEMRELGGDRMNPVQRERQHTVKASVLLMQLREDVKAMNSAISILSQKMRHLTRNEKILGRNLIVLNKKIKEMAEQGETRDVPEAVLKKFEEIQKKVDQMDKKFEELNIAIANTNRKFVSAEELKELRYVVDSINPLNLATLDQVKEIVKNAVEKHQKDQKMDLG
ncbi:MAG: hypothetical protein NT067_07380 [Candidatus Diapherotrites archaeon]|nr:hypothetical protein [Candidatus Diapherotrites archaeon]